MRRERDRDVFANCRDIKCSYLKKRGGEKRKEEEAAGWRGEEGTKKIQRFNNMSLSPVISVLSNEKEEQAGGRDRPISCYLQMAQEHRI